MIYTTHPKVSWGESSFSRGESRAFATGGGVLLNLLFLSSIAEVGQRPSPPRSHISLHLFAWWLHDKQAVLAKRLVTGLAQVAWRVVEKTGLTVLSALVSEATEGAVLLELK